jgi:hypothetical protein
MAARSTLTVTSGSTIASSWGNSVRDHVVPRTTTDDVSAEGQLAANTSTDRIVVHDGTAARRLIHYSSSGRTGAVGISTSVTLGAGTTGQIYFTMSSDPDGYYTGWDGAYYQFTVPSGLGGIYSITVHAFSAVTLTSGGMTVTVRTHPLLFPGFATPSSATNHGCTSITRPLDAGDQFSVSVTNHHSATSNFDIRIWAYRLFA